MQDHQSSVGWKSPARCPARQKKPPGHPHREYQSQSQTNQPGSVSVDTTFTIFNTFHKIIYQIVTLVLPRPEPITAQYRDLNNKSYVNAPIPATHAQYSQTNCLCYLTYYTRNAIFYSSTYTDIMSLKLT